MYPLFYHIHSLHQTGSRVMLRFFLHPQSGLASRAVKLKSWLASGGWIACDRRC